MTLKEYYKKRLTEDSLLDEATPAEIQAHQIQRLDKLGDKVGQKNLSNPANLRAATRIAMLYNKAGVAGGKYPYSGIAGSPGMISMPTRPAHPKAIAAAETGLKGLRGSNRTVGQRIRGAIKRTIGLEEAIRADKTSRQTQHRMRKARGLNPKRQNRISSADHADFDTLDPLNRARLRNKPVRAGMSAAKGFETAMKAEFGIPKYTNTDWDAVNAYQRELHRTNGIRALAPTPWSPQR